MLVAFDWDEDKHPRVPAGSPDGGQFEGGGAVGSWAKPTDYADRSEYRSADGKATVAFEHAANVTAADQAKTLAMVKDLVATNPVGDSIYLTVHPAASLPEGEYGRTMISSVTVSDAVFHESASQLAEARGLGIRPHQDPAGYVITHEYGHVIQADRELSEPVEKARADRAARAAIIANGDPVSAYGGHDRIEGYAEAFAMWRTASSAERMTMRNEVPGRLARLDQWKPAVQDLTASAYGPSDADLFDMVRRHGARTDSPSSSDVVLDDGSHIGSDVLDVLRKIAARDLTAAYNPDQARDDHGRWTTDGGDGGPTRSEVTAAVAAWTGNGDPYSSVDAPRYKQIQAGEGDYAKHKAILEALPYEPGPHLFRGIGGTPPEVGAEVHGLTSWTTKGALATDFALHEAWKYEDRGPNQPKYAHRVGAGILEGVPASHDIEQYSSRAFKGGGEHLVKDYRVASVDTTGPFTPGVDWIAHVEPVDHQTAAGPPDEARDEKGRWTKDGGGLIDQSGIDAVMHDAQEPGGGATIVPHTGERPTTGYAVGIRGHSSITAAAEFFRGPPGHERGRTILKEWVRQNRQFFADHPDAHIGVWHDPEHHEIVLDPSRVIADRAAAVRLGQDENQQSIADLGAIARGDWDNAFIDTSGSGDRGVGGAGTLTYARPYGRQGTFGDDQTAEADRGNDRRRVGRLGRRDLRSDQAAGDGHAGQLAARPESAERAERADRGESTALGEPAVPSESTEVAERPADLAESTARPERADQIESTEGWERAGTQESTEKVELAAAGESTESGERADRGESTGANERPAAGLESTVEPERAVSCESTEEIERLVAWRVVFEFDENKHPRVPKGSGEESGRFTDGGGGPPTVNGYTPRFTDLQTAGSEWSGYQESITGRWAADVILGEPHIGDQESYTPYEVPAAQLMAIDGDPPNERTREVAQEAYDRAYTLLTGIRDARPGGDDARVIREPLYRAMTVLDENDQAALDALQPGAAFDISLASFAGDRATATNFLMAEPGAKNYEFRTAGPTKAVPGYGSEIEEAGRIVNMDNIVSGRFQVVNVEDEQDYAFRSGLRIITVRQTGVFDPDRHGALVAAAPPHYRRPPFWRVFDPPTDAARTASGDFDESKHPRDAHGRFTDSGSDSGSGTQTADPFFRLLAEGDTVARNGPATDEYQQRALAYRDKVTATPDGAHLAEAVTDWQFGGATAIRTDADRVLEGQPVEHGNTTELLNTVNAAPPTDGTIVRGVILDHVPKPGDTLEDPLGSWSRNEAVSSYVMDINQAQIGQEAAVVPDERLGPADLAARLRDQLGGPTPDVYYRVVSAADYARMVDAGTLDTAGHGNLEISERYGLTGMTVSSGRPDLRYFEDGVPSRALAIRVHGDELQHIGSDAVVTRPLPTDRIVAVSDLIVRTGTRFTVARPHPTERVLLVADRPKAVPVSALAGTHKVFDGPRMNSPTHEVYTRPFFVTAQEFISGGRYHIDRVDHVAEKHGTLNHDNYRFGMSVHPDWQVQQMGEPRPDGPVPTTIVHVTQQGTYDASGTYHPATP